MNNASDPLDDFIEGTPFRWRQALSQGSTGVVAIPLPQYHDNIIRQAVALTPVYHLLGGFTVTSWLRTPEHNAAVGGAPKSIHLLGLATDFSPSHMTPEEARVKIKASGVYPGRGEEGTQTWVHLDLSSKIWFKL